MDRVKGQGVTVVEHKSETDGFPAPQAMFVSVGATTAPLIATLKYHRPRGIIFFVSQTLEEKVRPVLEGLPSDYRPERIEKIFTGDEEDIEATYRAILEKLPGILSHWGLKFRDLVADFTGGTKVMSAATVLALAPRGARFCYVGGGPEARRRDGTWIVVDGKEKILTQSNPWNTLAAEKIENAIGLLPLGRYEEAAHLLEGEGTGYYALLAAGLRKAFEGLAAWDRQYYNEAEKCLAEGWRDLRALLARPAGEREAQLLSQLESTLPFLREVRKEWERLAKFDGKRVSVEVFSGLSGREIPRDLCACAWRRAHLRRDYEDGVMMLYAAVEKMVKGRLRIGYGIDNSRCSADDVQMVPHLRERCARVNREHSQLGLQDSVELLIALNDEFGLTLQARGETLKKLQAARNHCWREHGYSHVKADVFDGLFPEVLDLLGFSETELVIFPDGATR